MNLDEFRKAMESDATVENERLKRDLADFASCMIISVRMDGLLTIK